jgi:hypothetical protein
MVNLDHIIEFEHEHTGLDFKLEEYGKHKKIDLVKDVMSMANASVVGDRLIIIGMKPVADQRGIIGLNTISDAASIQQLIIENIEPEINLDYAPYQYQGKLLGVIRIYDCQNKPYLMKKDILTDKNGLRKGEGFVRLGTTQARMYRSIFEQIYKDRYEKEQFAGDLAISFQKDETLRELLIYRANVTQDNLPSSAQRKKIEQIIPRKEKELKRFQDIGMPYDESYLSMGDMTMNSMANINGGGVAYEHRSLATLRKNLKNVAKTYFDEDYYFLLEQNSEKLVLYIRNEGSKALQSVKIVLQIAKKDGLLIATSLPKDPNQRPPFINLHYPSVEENDAYFEIRKDLGDLQPKLTIKIFEEPLRLCILPKFSESTIPLTMSFFAKNLATPIEKQLLLIINSDNPQ